MTLAVDEMSEGAKEAQNAGIVNNGRVEVLHPPYHHDCHQIITLLNL